jgi:hypothetical protein
MADQNEVDLDSVIDRLLEVRGSRPGKQVQLLEAEIRYLCTKAREIFISQPILLELEAPIKVRVALLSPELGFYPRRSPTDATNRSAVTFTVNTTISCDCSNMAAFLLKQTTSSSVTM